METLKNLGIVPIKPHTKESTEELKQLHYNANSAIFDYSGYINDCLKLKLIKGFSQIRKRVNRLFEELKGKPKDKAGEISAILTKYIDTLEKYEPEYNSEQRDKTIKYRVSTYLRRKESELKWTDEEIIKLLKLNKSYADCYNIIQEKHPSFYKMQDELLSLLTDKYKLS